MFKLKFKTGNAAFSEDCGGDKKYETIRILKEVIKKLENDYDEGSVMDINGNKIGEWTLTNR